MVDVFSVAADGTTLSHVQGVKIIPQNMDKKLFWADEVRLSQGTQPQYLYASTRGLEKGTNGYVAVFKLDAQGTIATTEPLCMYETPTSGGWANAVEPGPCTDAVQYLALTDSEDCMVMVLSWDGKNIKEVARVKLDEGAGAATAVWLD